MKPDVHFRLEIDEDLPQLETDRERIMQVLINLIGNAVKFTVRGEVCLRIQYADSQFMMSVVDTGIGIPQNELDRVFDKFHQIRHASTGSIKGTGLGLSICRTFADLIGASLEVESTVDVGSTFTLSVPRDSIVVITSPRTHLPKAC